jgi:hypothetical protein
VLEDGLGFFVITRCIRQVGVLAVPFTLPAEIEKEFAPRWLMLAMLFSL